jgi:hypothetical protein
MKVIIIAFLLFCGVLIIDLIRDYKTFPIVGTISLLVIDLALMYCVAVFM